jgi:IS30 family transposase
MHQEIATVLVDFYFANPYSPWQRGAWKSKWTYKAVYTQIDLFEEITIERIIEIQEKLNNREKRFNFETPNYMFNQKLHL